MNLFFIVIGVLLTIVTITLLLSTAKTYMANTFNNRYPKVNVLLNALLLKNGCFSEINKHKSLCKLNLNVLITSTVLASLLTAAMSVYLIVNVGAGFILLLIPLIFLPLSMYSSHSTDFDIYRDALIANLAGVEEILFVLKIDDDIKNLCSFNEKVFLVYGDTRVYIHRLFFLDVYTNKMHIYVCVSTNKHIYNRHIYGEMERFPLHLSYQGNELFIQGNKHKKANELIGYEVYDPSKEVTQADFQAALKLTLESITEADIEAVILNREHYPNYDINKLITEVCKETAVDGLIPFCTKGFNFGVSFSDEKINIKLLSTLSHPKNLIDKSEIINYIGKVVDDQLKPFRTKIIETSDCNKFRKICVKSRAVDNSKTILANCLHSDFYIDFKIYVESISNTPNSIKVVCRKTNTIILSTSSNNVGASTGISVVEFKALSSDVFEYIKLFK